MESVQSIDQALAEAPDAEARARIFGLDLSALTATARTLKIAMYATSALVIGPVVIVGPIVLSMSRPVDYGMLPILLLGMLVGVFCFMVAQVVTVLLDVRYRKRLSAPMAMVMTSASFSILTAAAVILATLLLENAGPVVILGLAIGAMAAAMLPSSVLTNVPKMFRRGTRRLAPIAEFLRVAPVHKSMMNGRVAYIVSDQVMAQLTSGALVVIALRSSVVAVAVLAFIALSAVISLLLDVSDRRRAALIVGIVATCALLAAVILLVL